MDEIVQIRLPYRLVICMLQPCPIDNHVYRPNTIQPYVLNLFQAIKYFFFPCEKTWTEN